MPEIGRFFGVDPVAAEYMSISTYQFAHNNPIWKIELEGLEGQEKQGKDVSHHEPVKVVTQATTATGVGTVGTKVVIETTKKAAIELSKSYIDDAGRLVLQGSKATAGTVLATVLAILTPQSLDEPQPFDNMPMVEPIPGVIDGDTVDTKLLPRTDTDNDDSEFVYRGGSFTDKNFTPRPGKDDGVGPKSGLSTFTDPIKATMGSGGKSQVLSVKALRSMGFQLTKTGDGHVGIRPPSQKLLQEWAKTRDDVNSTNPAAILTAMVKAARVTEIKVPK